MKRHLAMAIACLLASVPLTASANSEQAVPCGASFDPYVYSSAALQACGFQTFPRVGAYPRADGGTDYVYMVDGAKTVYKVPPPGFSVVNASADELAAYGLPPRPTGVQALAQWRATMQAKHFLIPPTFLVEAPNRVTAQSPSDPNHGGYPSANWSGWEAYANYVGAYTGAYGTWVEPEAYQTSCNPDAVVYWVGVGGDTYVPDGSQNTDLGQDGTGVNWPDLQACSPYR